MKTLKKVGWYFFLGLVAFLLACDIAIAAMKWADYLGYIDATEAQETPFPDILGGKRNECICSKSNPI